MRRIGSKSKIRMKVRVRSEFCCENCSFYNIRSRWCRIKRLEKCPSEWCCKHLSCRVDLKPRPGRKA